MALITNFEIIQKSVTGREYPMDKLNLFKDIEESYFMNECFGATFYDALKAVVADWSLINEWSAGTYALNDLVSWNGLILRSTANANTQEPSLTASQWTAASKFSVTEYNTLWNTYLAQIIANKVILACVVPDTYKATAKGLMKSTEDNSNSEPLDGKEMGLWFSHVQKFIDRAEEEMKRYMTKQYDAFKLNPANGFDYSDVLFLGDCNDCKTKSNNVSRKIGFGD